MMTVELDDRTAERLRSLAAASGMTTAEYLEHLFPTANGEPPSRLTFQSSSKCF